MAVKKKKSRNNKRKESSQKSNSRRPSGFLLAILIIAIVGLGAGITAAVMASSGGNGGSDGSGIKIPDYAYSPQAPKGADKAYQFAVDHPEYLAAVPCYCGCGDDRFGHVSNLDCFVKSRNGDDVLYDDHAFG